MKGFLFFPFTKKWKLLVFFPFSVSEEAQSVTKRDPLTNPTQNHKSAAGVH